MHKIENKDTTLTLWLTKVNFFLEHSCKVWYGYPTEIWWKFESSESSFIPLFDMQSRVAYVSTKVNFGHVMGTDSVNVVVPIS